MNLISAHRQSILLSSISPPVALLSGSCFTFHLESSNCKIEKERQQVRCGICKLFIFRWRFSVIGTFFFRAFPSWTTYRSMMWREKQKVMGVVVGLGGGGRGTALYGLLSCSHSKAWRLGMLVSGNRSLSLLPPFHNSFFLAHRRLSLVFPYTSLFVLGSSTFLYPIFVIVRSSTLDLFSSNLFDLPLGAGRSDLFRLANKMTGMVCCSLFFFFFTLSAAYEN
ncbi:hypothetical protein MPH_07728 [Macrophomina phaseolina MS6]|uniref:Uncharacterized protein n=1 Tax=Macrophomina phaseolina (strain MS6) TaxID=1126212 RepID=K2SDY6_MACPH|nr:hypothetical protein MPH_07728 [Macrophomina phaseolina MS6]